MFARTLCYLFLIVSFMPATVAARQLAPEAAIAGRWDITVREGTSDYPSWVEISRRDGRLTGVFIGRRGGVQPVTDVRASSDKIEFLVSNEDGTPGAARFTGTLKSDRMSGTGMEDGKEVRWSAVRAPSLVRRGKPRWGQPITLFNGKDLTGWKSYPPGKESKWEVRDGVLFNAGSGAELLTERKFDDFRLQLEFKIEPGSDSGVYLRGRYEIEIEDSYGKSPEKHLLGSIYAVISPTSLPAKRAGEWQTIDATLLGRRVTVVLNGVKIIADQEVPGITGGALDSNEGAPGPIMLQGDYGQVSYRHIIITPVLGKR